MAARCHRAPLAKEEAVPIVLDTEEIGVTETVGAVRSVPVVRGTGLRLELLARLIDSDEPANVLARVAQALGNTAQSCS